MTAPDAPEPLLRWARKLQSLAQTGLHYTGNPYDVQRYRQVRQIAGELFAAAGSAEHAAAAEALLGEFGPGTPKVVVRGAVFREGRICLVREAADGRWAMPGGWGEVDETPSANVEREVREETGLRVRAERLFRVQDHNLDPSPSRPFHVYTLMFLCRLIGGAPAASIETTEVAFFGEDELPPLSRTRNRPEDLALAFAAHRAPDAPATFD